MQHRALFFGALFFTTTAAFFLACKSSSEPSSSSSTGGPVQYTQDAGDAKFTSGDDSSKVGPPPAQVSSCDVSKDLGECLDYPPDPSGHLATDQCQTYNESETDAGVASESAACPTADRVGSCEATLDGVDTTYRYYSPKWTTQSAQDDCANATAAGGKFTAN